MVPINRFAFFFAFQSSAHCMARHWILIWALASVSYQVISISIKKIYFKACFAFLSGFAFLVPTKLINWHSRSDDLLSDSRSDDLLFRICWWEEYLPSGIVVHQHPQCPGGKTQNYVFVSNTWRCFLLISLPFQLGWVSCGVSCKINPKWI